MSHSITPARLLTQHLSDLHALTMTTGVLDLACGSGKNGLFLARHQIPVTFADINTTALATVRAQLEQEGLQGQCWPIDLEQSASSVLSGKSFDAIIVFNYLHRPLFPALKKSVRVGGLLIYETFTVAQRQYGRPTNPDYLLQPDELAGYFNGWDVLHNYEGELTDPQRAVAQVVVRKLE